MDETLKRCTSCGEWKPKSEYCKHKLGKEGLSPVCKVCRKAADRAYYARSPERREKIAERGRQRLRENPDRVRAQKRDYYHSEQGAAVRHAYKAANRDAILAQKEAHRRALGSMPKRLSEERDGLKLCLTCDTWKPLEAFSKATATPSKLRPNCRACRAAKLRAWATNNPDKVREYSQRFRAAIRAANCKYSLTPKGKVAADASQQRRRARKRSLPDTFTAADWQAALDHFNGCCAVCGRPPGLWHTLAADHWIPLTKGGGTTADNIVPLCHGQGGCNNSKSNRDAAAWLRERFGPRRGAAIQKRIEDWLNSRR